VGEGRNEENPFDTGTPFDRIRAGGRRGVILEEEKRGRGEEGKYNLTA